MKLSDYYPVHFTQSEASSFNLCRIGLYIRLALSVRKQRRQLLELPSWQLDDMGINPQDAAQEAKRALWDLPEQQLSAIINRPRGS